MNELVDYRQTRRGIPEVIAASAVVIASPDLPSTAIGPLVAFDDSAVGNVVRCGESAAPANPTITADIGESSDGGHPRQNHRSDIVTSADEGPHLRSERGSSLVANVDSRRPPSPDLPRGAMGPHAASDDNRRQISPKSPSPPGKPSRRLGAKSNAGVFHTIINQMPPHRVYIEPFLGWATIMKAKVPADRNIGIDRDGERIQAASLELPSAELTIGDGIAFLERFDWRGGELVYCDPPYLLETRTGNQRYNFELSDHRRLLEVLLRLPCPVILSGYESTLYAETLRRWRVVTYTGQTRGGPRTEYLWLNFPEPLELHDYHYLGRDFRERERIKRMQKRWREKLTKLPSLERHALMAVLKESQDRSQRPPPRPNHISSLEHSQF